MPTDAQVALLCLIQLFPSDKNVAVWALLMCNQRHPFICYDNEGATENCVVPFLRRFDSLFLLDVLFNDPHLFAPRTMNSNGVLTGLVRHCLCTMSGTLPPRIASSIVLWTCMCAEKAKCGADSARTGTAVRRCCSLRGSGAWSLAASAAATSPRASLPSAWTSRTA